MQILLLFVFQLKKVELIGNGPHQDAAKLEGQYTNGNCVETVDKICVKVDNSQSTAIPNENFFLLHVLTS